MSALNRLPFGRPGRAAILAVVLVAVPTGCSETTDLERAQAAVTARTDAVEAAQSSYDEARAAFCVNAEQYVSALDRYGKMFTDAEATVGDVRNLGADLARPEANVESSAQAAIDAHVELTEAQAELAEAQAELDAIEAGASTSSTAPTSTTTSTLLPPADVERIQTEQTDLTAAIGGVNDATPLAEAGEQVNAAAFALEAAWLRVLADAGCLTDDQMLEAQLAITGYTAAVQSSLKLVGYFDGEVDGIYGPQTVEAVQSFQAANDLPATGYLDQATAAALESALTAKGGKAAIDAVAATAALQATMKLAGFWEGPVDGQWTAELTEALKSFQSGLGVPPTGIVDTATIEALRQAISDAQQATTTTTPAPTTSTASTTTTSTTAPAAAEE